MHSGRGGGQGGLATLQSVHPDGVMSVALYPVQESAEIDDDAGEGHDLDTPASVRLLSLTPVRKVGHRGFGPRFVPNALRR